MRSLRVIMALTSEEGLSGFATDLDLVETSAGRTEEALSEMMNIAQVQADILTQSMEALERSVGKAWHSVDIWWKKTQLWWGTFLSGGDAGKAINEMEGRVFQIRKNAVRLLDASANLKAGVIDFDDVKEYLTLSKESLGLTRDAHAISKTVLGIQTVMDRFKPELKKGSQRGIIDPDYENTAKKINKALAEIGISPLTISNLDNYKDLWEDLNWKLDKFT